MIELLRELVSKLAYPEKFSSKEDDWAKYKLKHSTIPTQPFSEFLGLSDENLNYNETIKP